MHFFNCIDIRKGLIKILNSDVTIRSYNNNNKLKCIFIKDDVKIGRFILNKLSSNYELNINCSKISNEELSYLVDEIQNVLEANN